MSVIVVFSTDDVPSGDDPVLCMRCGVFGKAVAAYAASLITPLRVAPPGACASSR
jgi:hypothetical protein